MYASLIALYTANAYSAEREMSASIVYKAIKLAYMYVVKTCYSTVH